MIEMAQLIVVLIESPLLYPIVRAATVMSFATPEIAVGMQSLCAPFGEPARALMQLWNMKVPTFGSVISAVGVRGVGRLATDASACTPVRTLHALVCKAALPPSASSTLLKLTETSQEQPPPALFSDTEPASFDCIE